MSGTTPPGRHDGHQTPGSVDGGAEAANPERRDATAPADLSDQPGAGGDHGLWGTNLERAGDHNQRVTLQLIRTNGPIKRMELAEMTGLTLPAIANITRRLLSEKLILEAGREYGGRGQPATQLVINPDSCFSIGVNIDRDHLTIVLLDFAGRVRGRASRELEYALPDAVHAYFRQSVRRMVRNSGIDPGKIMGIGVAFPDDIDRAKLSGQPESYRVWGTVKLDELFAEPFKVPVLIENDAAAAALGEMQFGLGQQYRSFFYILIVAGLGGGIVINGQYFRGANGRSGELGWIKRKDFAGQERQLQNIISLSALRELLAESGYGLASPASLLRLDAAGTALISRWVEEAAEILVDPMLSINCLINPEAVLIGGRLPAQLVDRLAAELNRRLAPFRETVPAIAPILRAQTSDDAAAVGAGILPFSLELLPSRQALFKVAPGITI
jgi:predicted NBD/HSP70 family sugar kinase